jgi:hypothetical protein
LQRFIVCTILPHLGQRLALRDFFSFVRGREVIFTPFRGRMLEERAFQLPHVGDARAPNNLFRSPWRTDWLLLPAFGRNANYRNAFVVVKAWALPRVRLRF